MKTHVVVLLVLCFAPIISFASGVRVCSSPADPSLVCADTQAVTGTDLTQFQFEAVESGFYEVLVVDLSTMSDQFAGPLDLQWSVVQPPGTVTPLSVADSGALQYFLEAGTYFAQVFAVLTPAAQNSLNSLKFGMYGVSVRAVEVIPLPASVILLISALAGLFYGKRRFGHRSVQA